MPFSVFLINAKTPIANTASCLSPKIPCLLLLPRFLVIICDKKSNLFNVLLLTAAHFVAPLVTFSLASASSPESNSTSSNEPASSTRARGKPRPFFYPPPNASSSLLFLSETIALPPLIDELHEEVFFRGLDRMSFPLVPCPLDVINAVADLVQVETSPSPFRGSYYRRTTAADEYADPFFPSLLDRVSALEHKFKRVLGERAKERERKYTWTAEIEGKDTDRKYEWKTEIKPGKEKKGGWRFKWVTEVKEKGEGQDRTYTWTEGYGGGEKRKHKKDKAKDKKKRTESGTRLVEIEEPDDRKSLVLRQVLARRARAIRNARGKKKELSPQDAAELIQMNFRAYLIRRSQALRALRELAVAKTRLKEIRAFFNNFSYRRRLSRDAKERQRFSEKIIVLLLAVEAIEWVDSMVRCAKKALVQELEAMLDVVDPQLAGRSLSTRRRTFDVPDGVLKKEIVDGVAQIIRMLDQEEHSTNTSEA